MSIKGTKKYLCGSCGKNSTHHWIELNRSGGLKCSFCGSRNMDLVTKEAKEEAAIAQTIRVLGGTGSTTIPDDKSVPQPKSKAT